QTPWGHRLRPDRSTVLAASGVRDPLKPLLMVGGGPIVCPVDRAPTPRTGMARTELSARATLACGDFRSGLRLWRTAWNRPQTAGLGCPARLAATATGVAIPSLGHGCDPCISLVG